jgi:integrase
MRLTKPSINALKLAEGKAERIVFDSVLPGFGIRLRAGGKRTWIAQYRVGTKQRRVSFGSVETMDPDEARRRARDIMAKVQLGGDPQVDKQRTRAQAHETLADCIGKYLSNYAERNLSPRTLAEVRRSLNKHWKPLHQTGIHQIARAMVAGRLGEIAEESGPFAANRARAYLSGLFSWAVEQGLTDENPVSGTGRLAKEISRDRVLSDEELRLIWEHSGAGQYGLIVKLLLLTGQRREEVAGMQWDELDFTSESWLMDASRTKNSRKHSVPLSPLVLELLASIPPRGDRALCFGTRVGPFSGWSKAKTTLDQRINAALRSTNPKAKPLAPWRLHDLRRTAATRMADLGTQPHVVEAVLNHVSGHKAGIAGVYNHAAYATEKRAALLLWSEHISQLCRAHKP